MTRYPKYSTRALRLYLRLCALTQLAPWLTLRRAVVVAFLAASAAWLNHSWSHDWQYLFHPRAWYVVEDGKLYRSGQIAPRLITDVLRGHHIRVIVALTQRKPGEVAQDTEDRSARALGIEQFRFPLDGDGTGDIRMYEGAVEEMVR